MKLAIMQPYFLPYIGYFQLIAAVDVFVVYDNIKYTKKGWINRNRMLLDGEARYFTVPLQDASPSRQSDIEVLREALAAHDPRVNPAPYGRGHSFPCQRCWDRSRAETSRSPTRQGERARGRRQSSSTPLFPHRERYANVH